MTGQDILNQMEVLNQELQLQTGETDTARGLIAVNMAQDYFESLASQQARVLGDNATTVVTAANTETTLFPAGYLRIDRIQFIDPTTSRPVWDLLDIKRIGGHVWNRYWPWNVISTATSGHPRAYYTQGRWIYWSPLPSGVDTLRVYGFQAAADITASGTFAYADEVGFPIATMAAQILKIGVGDDAGSMQTLANQAFADVIKSLRATVRDGATPLVYTRVHDA